MLDLVLICELCLAERYNAVTNVVQSSEVLGGYRAASVFNVQ
jgi:hypothetical protein